MTADTDGYQYIIKGMGGQRENKNLIYGDLSYRVRGCVFKVYNRLGFGHKESIYQKALAIEFENAGLHFTKEQTLPITYNDKQVGVYRPDFIVEEKIIIELKAVEFMPKSYETQLIYYLKGTGYKLGFLINFGAPQVVIKRKINVQ
jgi:GxxExxY protein